MQLVLVLLPDSRTNQCTGRIVGGSIVVGILGALRTVALVPIPKTGVILIGLVGMRNAAKPGN